jgi:NADPH:quinone reductase-like Zn-dependent oxidoreductase
VIAHVESPAGKPSGVWWAIAAPFPVPASSAEQVVGEALALFGRETLLVHDAGGIAGELIVQLAAPRGIDVLATAGPRSASALARDVVGHEPCGVVITNHI